MRRSTGGAPSRALRRAFTCLLPLLAASILASPAQAGVRSGAGVRAQAASTQAIAGVLSQATGLDPVAGDLRSGVRDGAARVRAVRRGGARAQLQPCQGPPARPRRPDVHPGVPRPPSGDRIGASGGSRVSRARARHAGMAPAGLRPDVPVADRRDRGHGGGRRRRRRPDRRGRSRGIPQHVWAAGVLVRERLLREGQPDRGYVIAPGPGPRLGARGVARPRRGLGAVPELPHPARGGLHRQRQRPRQGRDRGGAPARQPDLEQLERGLGDADPGAVHVSRGRGDRRDR